MKRVALALALLLWTGPVRAEDYVDEASAPPNLDPALRPGLSVKLAAGPGFRRLFGTPLRGADMTLSVGTQRGMWALYGELEGFLGQTEDGLAARQVRTRIVVEACIWRFRLGLAAGPNVFALDRITQSHAIFDYGEGVDVRASVDLYRTERGHALYASADLAIDLLGVFEFDAPTTSIWGPSFALGVRY